MLLLLRQYNNNNKSALIVQRWTKEKVASFELNHTDQQVQATYNSNFIL